MALIISQTPASCSFAQSPIPFSVYESTGIVLYNGFQYICNLYYWTGSLTNSGSYDYTLAKYPNTELYGIFDVSRIINSTLTDLAQQNPSNIVYFACEFYTQYLTGSTYVTGSHVRSQTYKALDGYGLFQEPIGQQIQSSSVYWPLMTSGPATQSAFTTNKGTAGVFTGPITGSVPTKIAYTSSTGVNGSVTLTYADSISSSQQVQQYPLFPSEAGFPIPTASMEWYTVEAQAGSLGTLGQKIRFNIVCEQKYPNIRIKWKNRYGQFDWFNFNMINRQGFNTVRKTYQPQLGSWEGTSLGYQNYDSSILNYITDSKQTLSVQSDWVNEEYNEIFKQLLVSDEIYWVYDEAAGDLRPITILTDSITFKTGVVDKVIQYGFDFNWGQNYKLII